MRVPAFFWLQKPEFAKGSLKKGPLDPLGCLGLYRGWSTTQLCGGYFINHYNVYRGKVHRDQLPPPWESPLTWWLSKVRESPPKMPETHSGLRKYRGNLPRSLQCGVVWWFPVSPVFSWPRIWQWSLTFASPRFAKIYLFQVLKSSWLKSHSQPPTCWMVLNPYK